MGTQHHAVHNMDGGPRGHDNAPAWGDGAGNPLPGEELSGVEQERGSGCRAETACADAEGAGRLRGLTGKLRHPLVDVRTRAMSNISGKLSLGLLNPADLESEPSFFSDIVALLIETAPLNRSSDRSQGRSGYHSSVRQPERYSSGTSKGTAGNTAAMSGVLLSLCVQLAKDPSCRARLAGQGVVGPLSRMASSIELPGELGWLAAEVLALVEACPGAAEVDSRAPADTGMPIHDALQSSPSTSLEVVATAEAGPEDEAVTVKEAFPLYGDGLGARWPRWTKDLVDGPSLSARNASPANLVASLRAGWRFPPVRLVRSEESALFDFEVRFRTASGESRLLNCIEHLRDEILEDFPPEVLLQRPGAIGRLAALLRTPAASERLLEEALSTAKRLLERLVSSARLHLDDAFLPPSNPDSRTTEEGPLNRPDHARLSNGLGDTDATPFGRADYSAAQWGRQRPGQGPGPGDAAVATLLSFRYPQSSVRASMSTGDTGAPDGLLARGEATANRTASPGNERGGVGSRASPAAAPGAAAALAGGPPLVHRGYISAGEGGGRGWTQCALVAEAARRDRALAENRAPRGPSRALLAGSGEGGVVGSGCGGFSDEGDPTETAADSTLGQGEVSVCGALFALFLSACPLLGFGDCHVAAGSPRAEERGTGVDNPAGGISPSVLIGARGSSRTGFPSMVAVAAAELLQAMIPFLLEPALPFAGRAPSSGHTNTPTGSHASAKRGSDGRNRSDTSRPPPPTSVLWGQGEPSARLSCRVDAIRVQELLCSVGRVLTDTVGVVEAAGNVPVRMKRPKSEGVSATKERDEGGGSGVPHPLVSVALQLMLAVVPNDLSGDREDPLAVSLPLELRSFLRAVVMDTFVAEKQPSVRARLSPYLAAADPEGAELLEAAQELARSAESVLDIGEGVGDDHEQCGVWVWVEAQLRKVECALPLLRTVDDSRVVGAALALWSAAAVEASFSPNTLGHEDTCDEFGPARDSEAGRDQGRTHRIREAASAERVGASLVLALVRGSFGGLACSQALGMLEELTGPGGAMGKGLVLCPPGLAAAMVRRGLPDPRFPPCSAGRAAVSLAVLGVGEGYVTDVGDHSFIGHKGKRTPGDLSGEIDGRTVGHQGRAVTAPSTSALIVALLRWASVNLCSSGSVVEHAHVTPPGASQPGRPPPPFCSAYHFPWFSVPVDLLSDDADMAAAARRVLGQSFIALYSLLRPGGYARGGKELAIESREGSGNQAAVSLAATKIEGERLLRDESDGGTPGKVSFAYAVARTLAPTLEAFLSCCDTHADDSGPEKRHRGEACQGNSDPDRASLREVRKSVSALLDVVDGHRFDELWRGPGFPRLSLPVTRVWSEVRRLCLERAESRASASRKLAGFVMRQGGAQVGDSPFLYVEDPLMLPGDRDRRSSSPSTDPSPLAALPSSHEEPGASKAGDTRASRGSFTAQHVRNLADVAGSSTLEAGLRRAAAEQLRGVLVSPGVVRAVLMDGKGGREDLCEVVLRAALSGLLSTTAAPVGPSQPDSTALDVSPPLYHPSLVAHRPASGQWEEAFLGLLWAAVWKFSPVRVDLLDETKASAAAAATAVLRRLYHTKPSVRRLASRIAVRLAFDGASHFAPLFLSPLQLGVKPRRTPVHARGGAGLGVGPSMQWTQTETRCSGRRDYSVDLCGFVHDDEAFVVPPLVLMAYPRLGDWGDGSECNSDDFGDPRQRLYELPGALDRGGWRGSRLPTPTRSGRRKCSPLAFPPLIVYNDSSGAHEGGAGRGGVEDADNVSALASGTLGYAAERGADVGLNSDPHTPLFLQLAAAEWELLVPARTRGAGSNGAGAQVEGLSVAGPDFVARRLGQALQGAVRRADFACAMLATRAWMVAGTGFAQAFFGRDGSWESAFDRFLQSPPNSVKDRLALRDVASLLMVGTASMCPHGLDVLAGAAEKCFVPILSEKWRPSVLGEFLGDWKRPSKTDGPREIEAKLRLREAVLDLLVAIVSSPNLGRDAAQALAVSSLPEALWREFLVGGVRDWQPDEGRGKFSPRARRLATTFLTGLVRRCSSTAISAWARLPVCIPQDDDGNLLAAAGWGTACSEGSSVLLTEIVQSMVKHASDRRSPDCFRGRASLTAALVALQKFLAAATATAPAAAATHTTTGPGLHPESAPTAVREPDSVNTGFYSAGDRLFDAGGSNEGSAWEARLMRDAMLMDGRRAKGRQQGTNQGDVSSIDDLSERLAWLFGLACHRDSSVRSLAFAVIAEMPPLTSGDLQPITAAAGVSGLNANVEGRRGETRESAGKQAGSEGSGEGEAIRACVRASLDDNYESPAVTVEALRYLCRHVAACSVGGSGRLPGYATPLASSLARSTPPLLLTPVDGGDRTRRSAGVASAAGPLSVAASSLRFISMVVVTVFETSETLVISSASPSADDAAAYPTAERKQENDAMALSRSRLNNVCGSRDAAAAAGSVDHGASADTPLPQGVARHGEQGRGHVEHRPNGYEKEAGRLLKVLWASGCLEACVQVLGELPRSGSASELAGSGNHWGRLLSASHDLQTLALRRAQGDALALLRVVCCRPFRQASIMRPLRPPPAPAVSVVTSNPEGGDAAAAAGIVGGGSRTGGVDANGATAAPQVAAAVRDALMTKTPLLAGLVRCLVGVVASVSSAAALDVGTDARDGHRLGESGSGRADDGGCAVGVAIEACATLGCLLSADAAIASGAALSTAACFEAAGQYPESLGQGPHASVVPLTGGEPVNARRRAMVPGLVPGFENAPMRGAVLTGDLLSPGSAVPQAVLAALIGVLRWPLAAEVEQAPSGRDGVMATAKMEAKRLLSMMLAVPRWRNALDLSGAEASSLASLLLVEEIAALSDRPSLSFAQRRAMRAGHELRVRCLLPLLDGSDTLRSIALSSGLLGDLSVALEGILGEMATIGHGLKTVRTASRHLETLKASMRSASSSRSSAPAPRATVRSGRRRSRIKPPVPTRSKAPPKPPRTRLDAAAPSPKRQGDTNIVASMDAGDPTLPEPVPLSGARGDGCRGPTVDSTAPVTTAATESGSGCAAKEGRVVKIDAEARATTIESSRDSRKFGEVLESEFFMAAALMMSAVGSFQEGQAEMLRLRLPQLLWKAWPVSLASQLCSTSSGRSVDPQCLERPGGVLLRAILGLAGSLAKDFPAGKKAFIFAGPDGGGSTGTSEAGEWPRSSRSLLHRVAALALSGSPLREGSAGRPSNEPEYGRAACEAACNVIRSCALSPECRTVLAQSDFFVDAVAQISRLCAKAGKRVGTGVWVAAIHRVGDLAGVLVNASLRTEGQNAMLQVEGVGNMLGDLLRLSLRATAAECRGDGTSTSTGENEASRIPHPPPAVASTLLLLRNLALAPSTGEVAAHREPLLDLTLRSIRFPDLGLARAGASCLRAVLRGSSTDGGGKTAVGAGGRTVEIAGAVEALLRVMSSPSSSGTIGDGNAEISRLLRSELLAAKELL